MARAPRSPMRSQRYAFPPSSSVEESSEHDPVTARLSNNEVVDRTLETLRSGRVATAEVLVRDALSGSVETKDGAIEVVTARGERGLGVRVLDGHRIGFAHTSDLAVSGIEACVDQARRMATITEPDQDLRIATAPLDPVDLDIYEPGLEDRPLADRGAIALAVERAARTAGPRSTHFRKTRYSDSGVTTAIPPTPGLRASHSPSVCGEMTDAVAAPKGEGETRN